MTHHFSVVRLMQLTCCAIDQVHSWQAVIAQSVQSRHATVLSAVTISLEYVEASSRAGAEWEIHEVTLKCIQTDKTGTGQIASFQPKKCDTHDPFTQTVCRDSVETRLTIKKLPKLVYLAFDRVPGSLRVPPGIADDRVVSSQHDAGQQRG